MTKKEFIKQFSCLSHEERLEYLVDVWYKGQNEPITWWVAWLEIKQGTKLGKEILKKL